MFEVKDIMAELETGKSIEEIAKDVTAKLNEAQTQYKAKQAAEEAAKKAAIQKRKEKETRAGALMDDLFQYLTDFHPKFFAPDEIESFRKHFNAASMVDAIDDTIKQIEAIPAVAEQLKKMGGTTPVEFTLELKNEDAKQAEDAIEKFLRENKLF